MAAFTFDFLSARDGKRLRYGVFHPEQPGRKLCVLLGGHTEFIEKYLEVIHELNGRGFTVATFDWRGQGGSARALDNPLKSHVGDFAEYDTDLTSFMDEVAAKFTSTAPLLLAHSMGSHLALRALHDHRELFRAAVLVSPMLGISTRGYPRWLTRAATAWNIWAGNGTAFAWGMDKRDPLRARFETQLGTGDPVRFERTQAILRAHPSIRLGGPTWGWMEAAFRSLKRVNAPGFAEAIATPVLMIGAGQDRVVLTDVMRRFAARLPRGRSVEIQEAEHEILMDRDGVRAQFWQAFDGFVAAL